MKSLAVVTNQGEPFFRLLLSICVFSFILFLYFYGITALARESLIAEAILVIVFPAICFSFGLVDVNSDGAKRVLGLVIIETFFNVLVVFSRLSIDQGWASLNEVLSYGFLGFFVLQALGFIVYSLKLKKYLGVLNSVLFFILIASWFFHSPKTNVMDHEGRFLFWGENAPIHIWIYYLIWLVNVVFIDTVRLPNLRQAVVAFVSSVFAVFSGEFFHVRILTASHLFVLDLVFNYASKDTENKFCVMDKRVFVFFEQSVKPYLSWMISLILACIFIGVMAVRL